MSGLDNYLTPEFWDGLVYNDPNAAIGVAAAAEQEHPSNPRVTGIARGAAARALFELGRLGEARLAAQRAIDALIESDDETRISAALSAAAILTEAGDIDAALAALDALATGRDGADRGRIEMQRAYVLSQAGRLNEALHAYEVAERLLGHRGEPRDIYRLHLNRGLALLQQGRLRAAEDDFIAAERIATAASLTAPRALAVANRAVLCGRSRRLAESIALFDRAGRLYHDAGSPDRLMAFMEIDRAEVMLHSGLVADAVEAARRATTIIERTENLVQLGDAQLVLARAELAAGRHRAARQGADQAAELLARSGRREMVAHARSIAALARLHRARTADEAAAALADTASIAGDLRGQGWHQSGDEFLAVRARTAASHSLLGVIEDELEHLRALAASPQRDRALVGWYAEALKRRHDGDITGALDACRAGFGPLDEIAREVDTLQRRSAVMRLGNDLSQLTIECAVDAGDAFVVWAAAEGTRARALHDELTTADRHHPLDDVEAERLRSEVIARLGDRTLVEMVIAAGRILAVVLDRDGQRLVEIGDTTTATRLRDRVLMWLDVAVAEPDESSARAVAAARALDELLVAPLRLRPGSEVIVVPVDLLHGVPWAALPTLTDRPFTVVPSAQFWLEADRRSSSPVRTVGCIVGPELAGADVERDAIRRCHPSTTFATGPQATADAAMSLLARSDLLHVAAHGTFRSDRPLLSTLLLADGPAVLDHTVPERVHTRLVVLSSCEGGAQGTSDGSEVLGLAAVLLARGAASVLAPLTTVRDLECADFAAEVHDALAAGDPVGAAVAAVRRRWLADDDLSRWAVAAAFSCFGSAASRIAPPDGG